MRIGDSSSGSKRVTVMTVAWIGKRLRIGRPASGRKQTEHELNYPIARTPCLTRVSATARTVSLRVCWTPLRVGAGLRD